MGVVSALGRLLAPVRLAASRRSDADDAPDAPGTDDEARDALKALLDGLEACQRSEHRAAFASFHAAFIAYVRADDRRAALLVQKTIDLVVQRVEDPAVVRAARRDAVTIMRAARLQDEEARALFFLADFEADQRAFEDAYAHYDESLELSRSIGYAEGEAECLCRYARALALHGRAKELKQRLEQACDAAARSRDTNTIAFVKRWAEHLLSRGAVATSRPDAARAA